MKLNPAEVDEEEADVIFSEEDMGEDEQLSLSLRFEHSSSSVYSRHFWRTRSSSSRCSSCDRSPYPPPWRRGCPSEEWHLMHYVPSRAGQGRGYMLDPSLPPPIHGPGSSYRAVPPGNYPDLLGADPSADCANYHPINSHSLYFASATSDARCCHHATAFSSQRVAPPTTALPYERLFYPTHAPIRSPVLQSCPTAHACQYCAHVPVLTIQPRFRKTPGFLLPSGGEGVSSSPLAQETRLASSGGDGGRSVAGIAEQTHREADDERTEQRENGDKEEGQRHILARMTTMKRNEGVMEEERKESEKEEGEKGKEVGRSRR